MNGIFPYSHFSHWSTGVSPPSLPPHPLRHTYGTMYARMEEVKFVKNSVSKKNLKTFSSSFTWFRNGIENSASFQNI